MWTCEVFFKNKVAVEIERPLCIAYFHNSCHQQTGEVCPAFAFDAFEHAEVAVRGIGAGSRESRPKRNASVSGS